MWLDTAKNVIFGLEGMLVSGPSEFAVVRACRWGADHEHVTLSQFEDRVAKFKVHRHLSLCHGHAVIHQYRRVFNAVR